MKRSELIPADSFVEITEDVAVQNQSPAPIHFCECATQPKKRTGLMIEPYKVLKYTQAEESLWLYNPNTVSVTVGYSLEIA